MRKGRSSVSDTYFDDLYLCTVIFDGCQFVSSILNRNIFVGVFCIIFYLFIFCLEN